MNQIGAISALTDWPEYDFTTFYWPRAIINLRTCLIMPKNSIFPLIFVDQNHSTITKFWPVTSYFLIYHLIRFYYEFKYVFQTLVTATNSMSMALFSGYMPILTYYFASIGC